MKRGLVNDATDWYKYFTCTSIDRTCLPGQEVHRIRSEEMRKLIIYKFTRGREERRGRQDQPLG